MLYKAKFETGKVNKFEKWAFIFHIQFQRLYM